MTANTHTRARRAMTLLEVTVVSAVGVVVFGLILTAMTVTERASNDVVVQQQMCQEALLVSREVKRDIAFRVAASELSAKAVARGGAAPDPAAGGTAATTATVAATPPAASAVPVVDQFTGDALRIYSLARGANPDRLAFTILTAADKDGLKHAARILSPVGSKPSANDQKPAFLGASSDKFQTSVSFRYATDVADGAAKWLPAPAGTPRLVEMTVRVWKRDPRFADYASARAALGQAGAFELITGVALP